MVVEDIPEFVNRKEELKKVKTILSGRPNLIYFVYGPINSGKTALLMKVFEELPEDYIVFYFNFRGFNIQNVEDLIKVLFEIEYGKGKEAIKEIIKEFLKKGAKKLIEESTGIPIPEKLFDSLFGKEKKSEDVFKYLERLFKEMVRHRKKTIFVLDELQSVKEIINTAGRPLIHELFNFMVRLTKEMHLCHCLCATSDCLFIEDIYNNASLEGRVKYILVDDLSKKEAFEVYEAFGFENKELIWDFLGGKIGDLISLYEHKKQGDSEETALKEMLQIEVGKLRLMEGRIFQKYEDAEAKELWEYLKKFKDGEREDINIKKEMNHLFFWVEKNILFYNPVTGRVRPQGRLIQKAIQEISK